MKALVALVLSGLVLCACNPRPHDYISEGNEDWIIKIEQPGILDDYFSTNDSECVDRSKRHGYRVVKPNGEVLFISGTARITRTPNSKRNHEL